MVKDPKRIVAALVAQVGKLEARRLLVDEGISTSTAEKLAADRYPAELGGLITKAIMAAARKAKLFAA